MSRFVSLVVALVFLSVSSGFAQSFKESSSQPQPPAVKLNLSAKAAGIDAIATASARTAVKPAARANSAPVPAGKRSFWKSPWPYVIVAGVVAAGLIIANGGGGGY